MESFSPSHKGHPLEKVVYHSNLFGASDSAGRHDILKYAIRLFIVFTIVCTAIRSGYVGGLDKEQKFVKFCYSKNGTRFIVALWLIILIYFFSIVKNGSL